MIEWCFTPLLTIFQSCHGDSSHYSCFPGFYQCKTLMCLAQGQSHQKPEDPVRLEPRTLDNELNTLPQSHAGPYKTLKIRKHKECYVIKIIWHSLTVEVYRICHELTVEIYRICHELTVEINRICHELTVEIYRICHELTVEIKLY